LHKKVVCAKLELAKEKDMDKTFDMENARAQMRKSLLEYCILLAISQGELYASDILNELKANNLIVVEGTLYPMLSRLKADLLLEYTWKESKAGPPRKYYRLTDQGKAILEQLTQTWQELTKSINSLIKKYEKNN
jgi:PadR family transcriptional regulator PadR